MCPDDKPALRAAMLARLRALSADERRERSARLLARLTARDDWRRARTVGLFAPLRRSEPDLDALWTLPGALTGKVVAYPRMERSDSDRNLTLRVVASLDELGTGNGGRDGLREPVPGALTLGGWPDVLLVPGLAFTAAGGRLGRGGGYYDRFLARRPGRRRGRVIGAGFDFQLLPGLPLQAHDALLDEVVTG